MTSPRNAPAAIAVNTGERLTSSAAVPAGTVSSPPLSSSWYAAMPARATPVECGQVAPRRQPDAAQHADDRERHSRDEQSQHAQVRGAEVRERGADRRERGAPEHDGRGEGGGGAERHAVTVAAIRRQHK